MLIGGKEAPEGLHEAYDMVHDLLPEPGLVLAKGFDELEKGSWAERVNEGRSREQGNDGPSFP